VVARSTPLLATLTGAVATSSAVLAMQPPSSSGVSRAGATRHRRVGIVRPMTGPLMGRPCGVVNGVRAQAVQIARPEPIRDTLQRVGPAIVTSPEPTIETLASPLTPSAVSPDPATETLAVSLRSPPART